MAGQRVEVRQDEDGFARVSVATSDTIEEWEVDLDGDHVPRLVGSVVLA